MSHPTFNEAERAAIRWAELVTRNVARNADDAFAELQRHYDNQQIVDLTMVCCMFNMYNRFMDALQVPLEPPGKRELTACLLPTAR